MDALISLFKATLGTDQAMMLALFLFFLPLFFFAYWGVKRGTPISLRPIEAYAALKRLLAQAAEAGQPIHLSLGIAGIGDQATADTTAGLNILDSVAERAAISANPPIVTLANPTALPVAQDLLRRAYRRQGYPEEFDPTRAYFVAPDPHCYTTGSNDAFAYAAGVMQLLSQRKLAANVMVGRFGDEFLLMGETGAQHNLTQISGTSVPQVLPFVYATSTYPLIGEEIYAGGAYLSDKPEHVSSLFAQDVMRWCLVVGVVLAILLKSAGLV